MTRLITIPFSHFCEKARWALDRCDLPYEEDGHLPVFHYLPVLRAGGRRSVPVLIDGDRRERTVVPDSTEILAWCDARCPGALLPSDPRERADALSIEDDLDVHLGPATRRWGYFHVLPQPDADRYIVRGVPRWERLALRPTRPLAVAFLTRSLKIDAAGAERSRAKIDEMFRAVGELLADGRRFLVGERFTVADLALAALAAPVLLPEQHPFAMPPLEDFSEEARAQITAWRETRAGQHALRMYREHRDERLTVVVRRGAAG
jgi:glutathione S-transferase